MTLLKLINVPFKKVVLPRRVKCGGPEGEIVVAHGCWKRTNLLCGPEGDIVVASDRLPSPALETNHILEISALRESTI